MRTAFTVLSSWLLVIARVHPVHMMNAEQHQMATDLWTKPTAWAIGPPVGSYRKQHPPSPFVITTQPESR